MSIQLRAIWQRLQGQPRALLGMAVLLVLAWSVLLLDWDERRVQAQQQLQAQQRQLARLQDFAGEQQWLQAREASNVALAQFRARLWREESEGRIQAHFQDWLRAQLQQSGLQVRELAVSLPVGADAPQGGGDASAAQASAQGLDMTALPPDIRVVRAQVTLEFDTESLAAFLAQISSQERWLWLQRLQVQNHANRRSAELELAALFSVGVLGGEGGQDGAAP